MRAGGASASGRIRRMEIPAFRPARWLPGPHLQTVWGRLARPRKAVTWRREGLATPDGDTLWLDHADAAPGAPRALLLHGLEGSSYSVYVQGLATRLLSRGLSVTVLNFRSCARDPGRIDRWIMNARPRLYHSGETADLDTVVSALVSRQGGAPLFACGTSLGGNILLKWLGEHPGQRSVRAAVALSTPYDLAAGARHLENRVGRLYVRAFVRTLSEKAADLLRRFPAVPIDLPRARAATTFYEFDDAANAPLHGFAGAEDYWARSSSLGFLPAITTETLCVSSEDDPFLPKETLAEVERRKPAAVTLVVTPRGGHIGFVGGTLGRPEYWAEDLAAAWLAERVGPTPDGAGPTERISGS